VEQLRFCAEIRKLHISHLKYGDVPPINIIHDPRCIGTISELNILFHPADDMVLECSKNQLVKDVGSDQLMDVGAREVCSEWL
jgi:hypothetical protein